MQDIPVRTITVKRLSIIDWLRDGKPSTALALAEAASKWAPEVEHLTCKSAADVLFALDYLRESVPQRHIPLVHFEAHGVCGEDGGLSPDTERSEFLSWEQLRLPLRRLNIATRFNLIVFGAACYGIGFLSAIGRDLGPATFVASIGFADSIGANQLLKMTKEFYRSFFCDGTTIDDAIANANRESLSPKTDRLHAGASDLLLADAIRRLVSNDLTAQEAAEKDTRQACEAVMAGIFAYNQFPENRVRFPIDLGKLLPSKPA